MNALTSVLKRKDNIITIGALLVAAMAMIVQQYIEGTTARFVLACVFQSIVIGLLAAALVRVAVRWMRGIGFDQRTMGRCAIFTAVFAAVGIALLYSFFQGEKDIKTYDASLYWIKVLEGRDVIMDSIPTYLSDLRGSFVSEYNNLAAFPLLIFSYIFGTQFAGYTSSVFLVYYVPTCFFLTLFALRLNRKTSDRVPGLGSFALCFAACISSVCLLWPVMDGYLDVSGALVMVLLLNVSLEWDITEQDWRKMISIGLLSLLMLQMRRWYAFYIVGFYFAFALVAIIQARAKRSLSWGKVGMTLLNLALIATGCTLLILILNPSELFQYFGRNYAQEYSAYRTMSLWQNLWHFATANSILWVLLALAGAVFLLRKEATRFIALRLLVAMGTAVMLFCSIQDMGFHHYYLLLPTMILFICGFGEMGTQYAKKEEKPIFVISLLFIGAVNLCFAYVEPFFQYSFISEPFTTVQHAYPKRSPYYNNARQITTDLRLDIGEASKHVYVVGDGPITPEMLRRAFLPEMTDAAPFALVSNIADLRDGFPSQMFMADYLLVNKPYYSEYATIQHVNYQIYDMVMTDPIIEEYFALDSVYPVHNGETVLYARIKLTDAAFINALKGRLMSYYPDVPFVYTPNYFVALFQADDDTQYRYDHWNSRMQFEKTAGRGMGFRIHDTADFGTMTFALDSSGEDLVMTVENQAGTVQVVSVAQGVRTEVSVDIHGSEYVHVTLADAQTDAAQATSLALYYQNNSLE